MKNRWKKSWHEPRAGNHTGITMGCAQFQQIPNLREVWLSNTKSSSVPGTGKSDTNWGKGLEPEGKALKSQFAIKWINAAKPEKKHPNFDMIWSRAKPMQREQKIHLEDKVSKELNLDGSNDWNSHHNYKRRRSPWQKRDGLNKVKSLQGTCRILSPLLQAQILWGGSRCRTL